MERIFICGYDEDQKETLKNICQLYHYVDPSELKTQSLEKKISQLIEKVEHEKEEEEIGDLLVLFHEVDDKKISQFIDHYRQTKLPRPLWAVVTPHSKNWSLSYLINELKRERESIEKGAPKE